MCLGMGVARGRVDERGRKTRIKLEFRVEQTQSFAVRLPASMLMIPGQAAPIEGIPVESLGRLAPAPFISTFSRCRGHRPHSSPGYWVLQIEEVADPAVNPICPDMR